MAGLSERIETPPVEPAGGRGGAGWHIGGLEEDMRPRMLAQTRERRSFALATIAAADGGPRPAGSQMVITERERWGFLSGGCIEADVALHGRAVLADGVPRRLIYGRGSPFIDMRLPCGSRLEVLVERVAWDDPAVARLGALMKERRPARWRSDGRRRSCGPADLRASPGDEGCVDIVHTPVQRLFVFGFDPFALAIADQGRVMGWETTLIRPLGPDQPPPLDIDYSRAAASDFLAEAGADRWTAIAVATHDADQDEDALLAALASRAGYVGVLGARRRLKQRLADLRAAGLDEAAIGRLRAPIGLPIAAAGAREVAVAVVAGIIAARQGADAAAAPFAIR